MQKWICRENAYVADTACPDEAPLAAWPLDWLPVCTFAGLSTSVDEPLAALLAAPATLATPAAVPATALAVAETATAVSTELATVAELAITTFERRWLAPPLATADPKKKVLGARATRYRP